MDKHEFSAGYQLLLDAYADGLKDKSDEERKTQRDLYARMLREMDGALWQEVVGVAIRSSKWFPKISELVGYAAELSRVLGVGHDADAAFEIALKGVRRLNPLTLTPMSPVRDDVERVVRELGGWGRLALVEDDALGWYRKEFIATWNGRNDILARLSAVGSGPSGVVAGLATARSTDQRELASGPAPGEGVLDDGPRTPATLGPGPGPAREGES